MSAVARRVRNASRVLRKTPGFTISVVLALAVGGGLGVPVLGIIAASLRRTSPYTDPLLREQGEAAEWLPRSTVSQQSLSAIQDEALQSLLGVLLALTVFLLGITLINILTLLLAQATVRRPEIALRAVLGAVRRRLMGDLLVEGLLLVLLAGGLGLLIGTGALSLLTGSWPGGEPPWGSDAVDWRVLVAAVGVFVLVPLLAWTSPVRVVWRHDLRRFLTTGRGSTAGQGEAFVRNVLAVMQMAASVALLASAGLLLRGFVFSPEADRDIGFDPRNTFTAQIRLPEARGLSSRERHLLYEGVRDRISMLPGVLDTSVASVGGWVGLGTSDLVHALTGNPAAPGSVKPARYHAVSPGFFRMLRVPVLHGREFGPTDTVGAPRVVVVNKAFVNRFYLVDNGIRRNVQLHGISVDGPWYTIVGVVEDIRAEGLGSGTEPVPKVYLSALQHPPSGVGLAVRTTGDPMRLFPAVEEAVHFLAPEAKLSGAVTMEQYLARFRAPLRWFAVLLGVLAGVALLLATSGLHSVMSYNVTRRTREIGIRMAVGARAKDITRMVLGQSLRITIMGVMLGLFGALPLARLLQLLLRGVEPFDPLLFGGISVLLGSVSLLASYRPAQRAASVEPQISLQAE